MVHETELNAIEPLSEHSLAPRKSKADSDVGSNLERNISAVSNDGRKRGKLKVAAILTALFVCPLLLFYHSRQANLQHVPLQSLFNSIIPVTAPTHSITALAFRRCPRRNYHRHSSTNYFCRPVLIRWLHMDRCGISPG